MIDKAKVARSFSRSAQTYDQVAYFQRQVGERLLTFLPPNTSAPGLCMDLGCGTGYFNAALRQRYDNHTYLGVDIAEGMIQFCRQQDSASWLMAADAECLPLRDASVSLVYSNLALQWCEQLPQLFQELYRVTEPRAWVSLSTLGPLTLHELKQAWQAVDDLVHVNAFVDAKQWQQAIDLSGFVVEQRQRSIETLQYPAVSDLLRELKLLGAHNVNDGQRQTLTGRRRIQALLSAYQAFMRDEYYPATYEVLYWVLRKA